MALNIPYLSLLVWAPILGGVWVLYAGDRQAGTVRHLTLTIAVLVFAL